MAAGDVPLLLGPVELADALRVRTALLQGYFGQPGPTPLLSVAVPGEVVRDRGARRVEVAFVTLWGARAASLALALGRAGVREELANLWAPLALAGHAGQLPEKGWVRCHKGRVELREVAPDAHESGFLAVDLAGIEASLADAFAREALSESDWLSLGEYRGIRLGAPERPALPPEVLAAAADRRGVPKDNRALIASLYGSGKGPRKPRVVIVPDVGQREAGELGDDDAAEALAA